MFKQKLSICLTLLLIAGCGTTATTENENRETNFLKNVDSLNRLHNHFAQILKGNEKVLILNYLGSVGIDGSKRGLERASDNFSWRISSMKSEDGLLNNVGTISLKPIVSGNKFETTVENTKVDFWVNIESDSNSRGVLSLFSKND